MKPSNRSRATRNTQAGSYLPTQHPATDRGVHAHIKTRPEATLQDTQQQIHCTYTPSQPVVKNTLPSSHELKIVPACPASQPCGATQSTEYLQKRKG